MLQETRNTSKEGDRVEYLKVKNWDEFQQYKDGRPIHWIKLHLSLLDDYDFERLPEITQLHLIKIWAIAARQDNQIPNDPTWIARKIGAKSVDLKSLISSGFLVPYETVRECTKPYLEERREEKIREEKKEHRSRKTRLPADWSPSEKLISYCLEKRPDLEPGQVFEDFRDYYHSHGKTMADWDLTAMRWVRNERGAATKPPKLFVPKDDASLVPFAEEHGLPRPGATETYYDYRQRLWGIVKGEISYTKGAA